MKCQSFATKKASAGREENGGTVDEKAVPRVPFFHAIRSSAAALPLDPSVTLHRGVRGFSVSRIKFTERHRMTTQEPAVNIAQQQAPV